MDDEYEWQPPSEAEMKIIQARRERSDKISKLMGDYMLKGYKMLGTHCPECSTILLEDKHGVKYCVACKELDTDTDKDDPVLSQDAAQRQILEGSVTDEADTDLSFMGRRQTATASATPSTSATASAMPSVQAVSTTKLKSPVINSVSSTNNSNFTSTEDVLIQKINWATDELQKSNSVDYCVHLCQLIKSSADALQSLKSVP